MTQDHDDLDYDAWVVPPAPDVTDAVIAKARVPMATATETVDAKRSARTMLLAGGAIALSIAAIVIAVMIDRSKQPPPAPSIADLRVEELEKKVDELEAAITKLNAIGTEPTPAPAAGPEAPPCDPSALVQAGQDHADQQAWGAAFVAYEQAFDCKPSMEAALFAAVAACRAERATEAKRFHSKIDDPQQRANIEQACRQVGITLTSEPPVAAASPPEACDYDALYADGKNAYGKSQWGAALAGFEQALDCKRTAEASVFAAVSACKKGSAKAAKRHYKGVAADRRPLVQQTCLAKGIELGIEPDEPTASDSPQKACDADGFVTAAKNQWMKSGWGAALRSFEQAYACEASEETARWAAMSACKVGKATVAKRWFKLTRDVHRPAIQQTCLQKGIEL